GELHRAGGVVPEEDLLPRRAAILRAVHAARGVGAPDVPEHRDVDEIRIRRMHHDVADLPGVFKADLLPRTTGVSRLPHSVAVADVAANRILAAAYIYDVRIRRRDGDRADRAAEVAI